MKFTPAPRPRRQLLPAIETVTTNNAGDPARPTTAIRSSIPRGVGMSHG